MDEKLIAKFQGMLKKLVTGNSFDSITLQALGPRLPPCMRQ